MTDRINQQRASGEARTNEQGRQGGGQGGGQTGMAQRQMETRRGGLPVPYSAAYASPWDLIQRFSQDVDRMLASMGFGPRFGMTGRRGRRGRGMMPGVGTDLGLMTPDLGLMLPDVGIDTDLAVMTPRVDVTTRGDDLVIEAELPGIRPEDVEIEVEGNQLIMRGQIRDERREEDPERGIVYRERRFGSFYRAIPLPEGVNLDNAQANFNNGVLEVVIPGAARQIRPERRRIPVQGVDQMAGRQIGQGTATGTTTGAQAGAQTGAQTGTGAQQASQTQEGRQARGG